MGFQELQILLNHHQQHTNDIVGTQPNKELFGTERDELESDITIWPFRADDKDDTGDELQICIKERGIF